MNDINKNLLLLFFIYSTFAIVDSIGTCYAVTLYNIVQGQGVIIGDSVAIPEPYVTHVNFAGSGDQVSVNVTRAVKIRFFCSHDQN